MATSKTLAFKGLSINGINYTKHLSESASITLTEITDTIDDGQTLTAAYDLEFEVVVYETNIGTDVNVYTDAAAEPVLSNVVFQGVAGAANVTTNNIIVNGNKVYDQNRIGYKLFGTKRGVAIDSIITDN